ncbi:hypothetical protein [Massilia sp. TWP1-3-3]
MEIILMAVAAIGGAGAVLYVAHGLAEAQGRLDMLRGQRRRDRR